MATTVVKNSFWLMLLIAASIALYQFERRDLIEHEESKPNWLIERNTHPPDRIRLQDGIRNLELVREQRDWRVTASTPAGMPEAPRDDGFVRDRVKVLLAARVERSIQGESLAQRFLDPKLAFRLHVYRGPELLVSLTAGSSTPDRYGRYFARTPQGDVIILPEYQLTNLKRLLNGY